MIQKGFRDDTMSAVQIKVWHKHFKDGQESVESDPLSGRPATSRTPENVEHAWAAINQDRQLPVQELEANLGIPISSVSEILTQDLGMKCVVAKFIPQLLLLEQKEHCAAVANDLIQTATNEPDSLKKVVTLKGTEASFSYIQCFLYLVTSINVSILLIAWLDTFWAYLK